MHCVSQCAARTILRSLIPILVYLTAMSPVHAASRSPLALAEALEIATRDSPLLAAQRSAVTAAEQSVIPARELPDPKLRAGIENLPLNGNDKFSIERDFMTMRKIGVMQEFPRAAKRELRGKRAESELAREQAVLADTRVMMRREVALAWTERYFAERMAGVIDEQFAETKLQRETAQAGLRANKVAASDILALDVSLQMLLDRRAEFEREAARSTAVLSRWLGADSTRPLSPPPAQSASAPVIDSDTHIAHHPHLQALQRQIDTVQSEADLARVATQPDWGLEVTYAQRGPLYSNMLSFQISIDLPVFSGRRQQPAYAAKLAQVEQTRALREESLRQHFAEARVMVAEWQAATARLKRFDDALLPLARERAQLALAAYRGGQGALAPVLEARRSELELKLQKLQLAAQQGRAYAQLLYFLPEENMK